MRLAWFSLAVASFSLGVSIGGYWSARSQLNEIQRSVAEPRVTMDTSAEECARSGGRIMPTPPGWMTPLVCMVESRPAVMTCRQHP